MSWWTILLKAAQDGDVDNVRELLEQGRYDINEVSVSLGTPLYEACRQGNLNVARVLIGKLKDDMTIYISIISIFATVLMLKYGHDDVAHALLEDYQCPVDTRDKDGNTVLHYACRANATQSMKTLIQKYKYLGNDKALQVSIAARSGDVDKVRRFLKDSDCDVNLTDNKNWTPLHYACTWGDLDMARMLIETFKADMTIQNSKGATALMLAIKHGHDNVAHALLEDYQCPVDIRDKHGDTVLHYACRANATQSMKTLIQKYKDMYSRNDGNNTPLNVAAYCGKQEVALALIQEFGCDVNIKGYRGRSALHSACAGGHVDMVKCLSKYISPLVVDDYGDTPLHTCCEYGKSECVEALLALNAPVLIRNIYGNTPKDVAIWFSTKPVLEQYMRNSTFLVHYDNIQKHAKKRYSSSDHITRLFVLGNPGAGKSSFIMSLKREGFFESFWRVSESSVPPHTAGIVPSIHTSKHYGRVLFYDFAGDAEYYSSHAAILENLACTSKGDNIFIIVVDLRNKSHKISCLINYWVSFIQYQLFKKRKPQLVILGSHLDLVNSYNVHEFEKLCEGAKNGDQKQSGHFMLDCCSPKSKGLKSVVQHIATLVKKSSTYKLSQEGSVLLGLLEKDFQQVTACPIQTIISHIEDTKMPLPTDKQSLCKIVFELHELGLLFMIKGDSDVQLVLNMSRLTHDVHQLLFSEEAIERLTEKSGNASLFHVGIISEAVLSEVLPAHITKEILIQLQYCQVIHHKDVGTFSSSDQCNSSVQSYLFFPALCSAEKSDIAWVTPPDLSYGIGWLARCTDPRDYFPPRFHHVLFLRLVFNFVLSDPTTDQSLGATPDHKYFPHYCIMWKTGLYWITKQGVECMVELKNTNTEVVVRTKTEKDLAELCIHTFHGVVSCVTKSKADFCHSVKPEIFLLDSTDCLDDNSLFAMSEVSKALSSPPEEGIRSVTRKTRFPKDHLLFLRKFSLWQTLFPITIKDVLHYSKDIVRDTYDFGLYLNLPPHVLEALQVNFPTDVIRMKREVVKEWMSSSQTPPCWYTLAEALRTVGKVNMAAQVQEDHGEFVNVS